jgi:hypothetical protein
MCVAATLNFRMEGTSICRSIGRTGAMDAAGIRAAREFENNLWQDGNGIAATALQV